MHHKQHGVLRGVANRRSTALFRRAGIHKQNAAVMENLTGSLELDSMLATVLFGLFSVPDKNIVIQFEIHIQLSHVYTLCIPQSDRRQAARSSGGRRPQSPTPKLCDHNLIPTLEVPMRCTLAALLVFFAATL